MPISAAFKFIGKWIALLFACIGVALVLVVVVALLKDGDKTVPQEAGARNAHSTSTQTASGPRAEEDSPDWYTIQSFPRVVNGKIQGSNFKCELYPGGPAQMLETLRAAGRSPQATDWLNPGSNRVVGVTIATDGDGVVSMMRGKNHCQRFADMNRRAEDDKLAAEARGSDKYR